MCLFSIFSGAPSRGFPFLSKYEHKISRVGISENGLTKAVLYRGITYKSLEPASTNGSKLDPSTRSPAVNILSKCSRLPMIKFKVLSLPSEPMYLKFIISISLSSINLIKSAFVSWLAGLFKY